MQLWLTVMCWLFQLGGLSWAQALVPLQAAAFATITPAATGAASTVFNTSRQLGMAAGVAILTTVASAVGLTKHVAAGTAPHLAAYHAGFVTASIIALIGAGVARCPRSPFGSRVSPDLDVLASGPRIRPRRRGGHVLCNAFSPSSETADASSGHLLA